MALDTAYYTYSEVMDALRCGRSRLRTLIAAGLLVAHGSGSHWMITSASYDAVAALIAEGTDPWAVAQPQRHTTKSPRRSQALQPPVPKATERQTLTPRPPRWLTEPIDPRSRT